MTFHQLVKSVTDNRFKVSLSIIVLLSFSCVSTQELHDVSKFLVAENEEPWVIAHRGGKGLFPENTMTAFDGSDKLGVDALEMDVCLTKDGVLVTHHDLTIDRTSDGKGLLSDYTYAELQTFNFGYHFRNLKDEFSFRNEKVSITPFKEVVEKYGKKYPLIIEIKNKSEKGYVAAQKLYDLISKHQLKETVIVASFHDEVLNKFKELSSNQIITASSVHEGKQFVFSRKLAMPFLFKPKNSALQIPMSVKGINLAKKGIIKDAHRRKMLIHYWTINTKENMKKLINLHVDGIMTDRPDLLIELYKEMRKY